MGKDFKSIRKAAKEQGWKEDVTAKGHPRFFPPDNTKPAVVTAGTPSDQRSIDNFLSAMKRSGLIWPWPPPKKERR